MNTQQKCEQRIRELCPELQGYQDFDLPFSSTSDKDIHLEDILNVIQGFCALNDVAYYASILLTGNVQKLNICVDGKECNYNLSLPFSQQPQPVFDFLLEILK